MIIKGNVEGLRYGQSVNDLGMVSGSMMTLTTDAALNFLNNLSVIYPALAENSLGLYSYGSIGRNGKVKFAQMTNATPHMLRPRGNKGCIWNPVGNIAMNVDEFEVKPVKFQSEFCPDNFWGTCLEKLMGVGNAINDVFGTPESSMWIKKLVTSIYESLGNSIHMLAWFAEHNLIAVANTNDTYDVTDEEWAGFVAQQALGTGGWMTLIDAYKEAGVANYNVQIRSSDVGVDGEFVGDVGRPNGLFSRLVKGSSKTMKLLNGKTTKGSVQGARITKNAILVSKSIFEAYEAELLVDYGGIKETLYYFLSGEYASSFGLSETAPLEGVLKWKGHPVICMDQWDGFYDLVNVEAHVAMMIVPGVLGLAYDVASLEQYNGLGLIMEQKLGAPDLGKVYLHTNFDMGMGVINPDLITYARLYLPKA